MKKHSGFTLIELSLVLVIIALVIGGILVGQDLIRSARLKKTMSEAEQYKTAFNTFRIKYGGLPGDLANGYDIFGSTCYPDGDQTHLREGNSGNGDGIINMAPLAAWESTLSWCQLALSGIIPGHFGGTVNSLPPSQVSPQSSYSAVAYFGVPLANSYCGFGSADNCIELYGIGAADDRNGAVTPMDGQRIDTKMDDGQPYAGVVHADRTIWNPPANNCGSFVPGANFAGSYYMVDDSMSCRMIFKLDN